MSRQRNGGHWRRTREGGPLRDEDVPRTDRGRKNSLRPRAENAERRATKCARRFALDACYGVQFGGDDPGGLLMSYVQVRVEPFGSVITVFAIAVPSYVVT